MQAGNSLIGLLSSVLPVTPLWCFASLLVAFWLRFDTALRDFGVEMHRDRSKQLRQLYYFRFRFFVAGARSEADV